MTSFKLSKQNLPLFFLTTTLLQICLLLFKGKIKPQDIIPQIILSLTAFTLKRLKKTQKNQKNPQTNKKTPNQQKKCKQTKNPNLTTTKNKHKPNKTEKL